MELVDAFTCPAGEIRTIRVRNLDETEIEVDLSEERQDILVEIWGNPQTTHISVDHEGSDCLEVCRAPHTRRNAKVILHVPTSFQRNEHRKTFTLMSEM